LKIRFVNSSRISASIPYGKGTFERSFTVLT
jgi:hypothetical protein